VEAAYHLNHLGRKAFFRNSLLALRQEQYRAPGVAQSLINGLAGPKHHSTDIGLYVHAL
jgi:hypothetical protein